MVDESDPQGEIKPSTHRAKNQKWIYVASAFLVGALFLDSIMDFIGSEKEVPNKNIAQPSAGFNNRDFQAMLESKRTSHKNEIKAQKKDTRYADLKEELKRLKAELDRPQKRGLSAKKNNERKNAKQSDWDSQEISRAQKSYLNSKWKFALFNKEEKMPPSTQRKVVSDQLDTLAGLSGNKINTTSSPGSLKGKSNPAYFQKSKEGVVGGSGLSATNIGSTGVNKTPDEGLKHLPTDANRIPNEDLKHLPAGTVIHAAVSRKIMSDYAGHYTATITRDVYDVSRNYIIIPKGSTLIGEVQTISNVNEIIQNRVVLTNRFIVLPQGRGKIDFSKTSETTDREGINAVGGETNYHWLWRILGVSSYAVLSNNTSYEGSGRDSDRSFGGDIGDGMRDMVRPLSRKLIDLKPTIVLDVGEPVKIFMYDEMYLKPWGHI